MKKHLIVLGLSFALCPAYSAFALGTPAGVQNGATQQRQEGTAREEAAERAVHITNGPHVTNVGPNSATITWETNSPAANQVQYRAHNSSQWRSAYEPGGSTHHVLHLNNLQPGEVYSFRVMTREQDVRTSGSFRTLRAGAQGSNAYYGGTAGAAAQNSDRDRDNDRYQQNGDRDSRAVSGNAAGQHNNDEYYARGAEHRDNGKHKGWDKDKAKNENKNKNEKKKEEKNENNEQGNVPPR